jgi:mannose-6-phosphate isomerase-like protein (cupin superfamily)
MAAITRSAAAVALLMAVAGPSAAQEADEGVREILERYAADYEADPSILEVTFAIEVDGSWWHVVAEPASDEAAPSVQLRNGKPAEPTFYFTLGASTLERLDRGELNPETAMVKAFSTDPSPMDVEAMEGFEPGEDFLDTMLRTTFHFWTRGLPEIIPFGESHTRFTHGADAVVFYYQPGFRSGWLSLKPGQHGNEDPRMQTNPFPSLFVVTGGKGKARIGGVEVELRAGQAILVPAEVAHEFWNPFDEPMEAVLLMFGEGA